MTAVRTEVTVPARGTRPRNRRELILAAAAALFYRHGYDRVATSDLAEAVNIGPSALYRHFPSKQHLLAAVMFASVTPARELLAGLDLHDTDAALRQLVALALDQRRVGVLWERDARSMASEDRHALRAEVDDVVRRLTELVAVARPNLPPATADLLGRALLAVLISPSHHHLDDEALLLELAAGVIAAPVDTFSAMPQTRPGQPLLPGSRREAILGEATRLFAERGFAGVSLDDIGAALGIAGPTIYNHFASKLDIITTALNRGTSYLMMDLSEALAISEDPAAVLRRLIDSYIHLATAHPHIVGLLITESGHLPEGDQRQIRQIQRDYIAEWTRLLALYAPDADPTAARIRVQAAFTVINHTARAAHLRAAVGYPDAVRVVVSELVLGAPRPA